MSGEHIGHGHDYRAVLAVFDTFFEKPYVFVFSSTPYTWLAGVSTWTIAKVLVNKAYLCLRANEQFCQ